MVHKRSADRVLEDEETSKRQKILSDAFDRKDLDDELHDVHTPSHVAAYLKLVTQDGAGQWLVAPPSEDNGTLRNVAAWRVVSFCG